MIYGNIILENKDVEIQQESLQDIKQKIMDLSDLKAQWKAVADKFVKHKWLYRYTDEIQKQRLQKHYEVLCNPESNYSSYKRSFAFICKYMGLQTDKVIIENLCFQKDKKDKEQDIVAVKYSKGLAKVKIPENIHLIHVSPADNITALNPSFRSKVQGKYMYPTKRCFFTVAKEIKPTQAGLEHQKNNKIYHKG